jgi:hypothetical protein
MTAPTAVPSTRRDYVIANPFDLSMISERVFGECI